jgi:hypothetical protein
MAKEKAVEKKECFEICEHYFIYNLGDKIVPPFQIQNVEIQKLLSYFLHEAPNIESAHSRIIPRERHSDIYEKMFQGRHFVYRKICSSTANIETELKRGNLHGELMCLKCKRYVCKRKSLSKKQLQESDLECFLRHIRNSIAHGRVYYVQGRNRVFIVFEDLNNRGNLSARIVCIKADLEHWKKELSRTSNYT